MKTKKIILTTFVNLMLIASTLQAQQPTFVWAKQIGGNYTDLAQSITTDANGNVYTTGYFGGTADFDPGAGTVNLTSNGGRDIYVQKLDAKGNFLWAKQMGGTDYWSGITNKGNSIVTDANGNVYTTGAFGGTVDFDPGAATTNLTSVGGNDIFIQKLDANGNLIWVKQIGGGYNDNGLAIATDAKGNLYITGNFTGTVDFDPGVEITNLTSAGSFDIFIQKLDNNGNLLWVKKFGDKNNDWGNSITTDANGNVYTTGFFEGVVDFDPGAETANLTSAGLYDAFIQKLDADGNLLWVKQMGGTRYDRGNSITVDANGNVYTIGEFEDTADFDPGTETANLTSAGSEDIFIQKLDVNGNFLWVNQIGGKKSEVGNSITVDANGNVYSTGSFTGTVDFNPGTDIINLTDEGGGGAFIQKLDGNGNLLWVKQIGGTATSITSDVNGNIYTTGYFFNTKDFDPGDGTANLTSTGESDIFIHKLSSTIVGLSESSFSEDYVVCPNPTDGKFSIKFDNTQESVTVRILSLTGQVIVSKQFQNTNNIQLEIEQPNGIYILETIDEQGTKSALRIVKQ